MNNYGKVLLIFNYIKKTFNIIKNIFFRYLNYFYFFKNKFKKTNFKVKKFNTKKNKAPKIVFIYRNRYKENGSTKMRVFQINKILKIFQFSTITANETQISNIQDSICILNKSFLKGASIKELECLISKSNILCFDYIDSLEQEFQIEYSSIIIASSIKQFKYYKSKYKNKIIHLINHHVDPRIKIRNQNKDLLNIGYFGEKENGLYLDKLKDLLIPNYINTKKDSKFNWIIELEKYNAHYIVRKTNNKKVFKPFLKGFTAAHCESNVIAYKYDGDSEYYLTDEYPYMLEENSYENILKMFNYMNETFNSDIWFYGLEIMREIKYKSSEEFIANQFKLLIKTIKDNDF